MTRTARAVDRRSTAAHDSGKRASSLFFPGDRDIGSYPIADVFRGLRVPDRRVTAILALLNPHGAYATLQPRKAFLNIPRPLHPEGLVCPVRISSTRVNEEL